MTHAARLAVTASTPDSKRRSWIEVMPTGEKLRNGSWLFTITRDDLDVYAEHIRANADAIPVDYDHAEAGTKAAGWFTGQAEVRGSTLWAEVEWTPAAADAIRDGEWKRVSPEFTFESKDAKTGLMTRARALLGAALTNRPFFRELAPVTAATRGFFTTEGGMMAPPGVTLTGVALMERGAEILAGRGISDPTEDELVAACAQAETEGVVDDYDPGAARAAWADRAGAQNEAHARAVSILADSGRELTHTQDEYLAAYDRAERELARGV